MTGENRGRKPKTEFISIIENEIIKFKHEIVQDGNSKILYIIFYNIITPLKVITFLHHNLTLFSQFVY